jgi:hypothetical protein
LRSVVKLSGGTQAVVPPFLLRREDYSDWGVGFNTDAGLLNASINWIGEIFDRLK